jgi:hypothetical protein
MDTGNGVVNDLINSETSSQACIRRTFPSARNRGLSGNREGRIHVAAIPAA